MITSLLYLCVSTFRVYYTAGLISDFCSISVTGIDTHTVVTVMYVVVTFYTTVVSIAM
jgi:hypothetical protein